MNNDSRSISKIIQNYGNYQNAKKDVNHMINDNEKQIFPILKVLFKLR